MKLLLLLTVLAVSCFLAEGFRRRTKNRDCLVKHKYAHEKVCRGPRRVYYRFHRVLFDCIQMTTRCYKFFKRNEFDTLKKCRDGCAYHMKIPTEGAIATTITATTAGGAEETTEAPTETPTEAPTTEAVAERSAVEVEKKVPA
ncbi:uncharacterized protein LOC128261956 [Drosophila gunungcola]|uniref:Uncharacterized protein n=1 Tax=Drosophila gunungcola TaxID=103775 RepID=A0A9Q0BSM4_9MUSC|nr:uncharacterized protein LOC128261956 [Drosophila gunungcola]KAI8042319.1 hypothetical protein M5D96_003621 [Drosophila gunungcola]